MPEEKVELRSINWREAFSWTELFRGFRIALDFKKLLLAGVALTLVFLGCWLLGQVWGAQPGDRLESECPWFAGPGTPHFAPWMTEKPFKALSEGAKGIVKPVTSFVSIFWAILVPESVNSDKPWQAVMYGITALIWVSLVWCVFAGAITRIAAVQLAREEKIGLSEAVKFAIKKIPSYIGAPLFPIIGIAFFVFMCFLAGWFGRIPYLGEFVVGLLWFLPLIAGFLIIIIGIGLVVGWPLMFATISTEGTDSFDAISRSYSYIYQRPWKYAWYWLVSLVYGAIVVMFVVTFVLGMSLAARYAVGLGMRQDTASSLQRYSPTGPVVPGGVRDSSSKAATDERDAQKRAQDIDARGDAEVTGLPGEQNDGGEPTGVTSTPDGSFRQVVAGPEIRESRHGESVAAVLVAFWVGLLYLMMMAFAYSFFWSMSTIIYFLLRKDVDAAEMDEVFFEDEEEDDDFDLGMESPPIQDEAPADDAPAEEPAEEGGQDEPPAEQGESESDEEEDKPE